MIFCVLDAIYGCMPEDLSDFGSIWDQNKRLKKQFSRPNVHWDENYRKADLVTEVEEFYNNNVETLKILRIMYLQDEKKGDMENKISRQIANMNNFMRSIQDESNNRNKLSNNARNDTHYATDFKTLYGCSRDEFCDIVKDFFAREYQFKSSENFVMRTCESAMQTDPPEDTKCCCAVM